MTQPNEIRIDRFDGGISDDVRQNTSSMFANSQHFDIFSNPNRLTPYRSTEADTSTSVSATDLKQYDVRDFVYHADGTNTRLYAQGQSGTGKTKIVYKADPTTGDWTLPSSSESTGSVKYGSLLSYLGKLVGFTQNNVFVYDTVTPGFTYTAVGTTTTVVQGVIAKDKSAYLAYNNKIVRVATDLTVTDAVLTLSANYKINSIESYGNYLAIACSDVNLTAIGKSTVFLWDLVSTDVTEAIDWGEGQLTVIGNVEGRLVGVTNLYLNSTLGISQGRLIVKVWSGGTPSVIKQVCSYGVSAVTVLNKGAARGNKFYFVARVMTGAATYVEGIWAYGRNSVNTNFALTIDYIEPLASTANGIRSIGFAGNYWFINHSADGSVTKTNDAATFANSSIYETQIYNGGDVTRNKTIKLVGVGYVFLPSGASVVLKYRKNEATAWTTITTRNTANEISFVDTALVGNLVGTFKEIQFRIESTGGAEITELRVRMEIEKDIQ